VQDAEERAVQLIGAVARRHARVTGRDAGTERVHRRRSSPALKSKPSVVAASRPSFSCASTGNGPASARARSTTRGPAHERHELIAQPLEHRPHAAVVSCGS
jgi:hypothetical protein